MQIERKFEVSVAWDWMDTNPEITSWPTEQDALDWAHDTIDAGVKLREVNQGEPITDEMRAEFWELEALLVQVYEV